MDLKIMTDDIEQAALDQITTLASIPAFENSKIRIMPDVHAGKGCVIGFTADMEDKIIPNVVGVDIGCGMLTVDLGKQTFTFPELEEAIQNKVPSGMNVNSERIAMFPKLQELYCYGYLKDTNRLERSIGTLGGGNHFIEIDKDEEGNSYLVIHSGSRNLGKQVAEFYQGLAADLMNSGAELKKQQEELIAEYKAQGKVRGIQSALRKLYKEFEEKNPKLPADLCYLSGKWSEEYLHDMRICQEYATLNRQTMAYSIISELDLDIEDQFETIHNYIDFNSNIIRKGAVSAKKGERLLIPINMKDGCIYGVGKGNEDWNCSAPHGAGRVMSRMQARENISLNDFVLSMKGIYSESISEETIDESPFAYRSIDKIIDKIEPTVEVRKLMKPVYNFKAKEW